MSGGVLTIRCPRGSFTIPWHNSCIGRYAPAVMRIRKRKGMGERETPRHRGGLQDSCALPVSRFAAVGEALHAYVSLPDILDE